MAVLRIHYQPAPRYPLRKLVGGLPAHHLVFFAADDQRVRLDQMQPLMTVMAALTSAAIFSVEQPGSIWFFLLKTYTLYSLAKSLYMTETGSAIPLTVFRPLPTRESE